MIHSPRRAGVQKAVPPRAVYLSAGGIARVIKSSGCVVIARERPSRLLSLWHCRLIMQLSLVAGYRPLSGYLRETRSPGREAAPLSKRRRGRNAGRTQVQRTEPALGIPRRPSVRSETLRRVTGRRPWDSAFPFVLHTRSDKIRREMNPIHPTEIESNQPGRAGTDPTNDGPVDCKVRRPGVRNRFSDRVSGLGTGIRIEPPRERLTLGSGLGARWNAHR